MAPPQAAESRRRQAVGKDLDTKDVVFLWKPETNRAELDLDSPMIQRFGILIHRIDT